MADGRQRACLCLEHDHTQEFRLQWFDLLPEQIPVPINIWEEMTKMGLDYAKDNQATKIRIRITESYNWREQITALKKIGFTETRKRIEFRRPISELPGDNGSPFVWKSLVPLGDIDEIFAASILKKSAVGDPSADPGENSLLALRSELSDPVLTSGPDCVQLAYLNQSVAGIVIAQINPKTKWSRISYMGLLPEYRNQGLGKWVHRHGFEIMRSQGGELYHGGTNAENTPMLKLFLSHGCLEYRKMQEWIYQ